MPLPRGERIPAFSTFQFQRGTSGRAARMFRAGRTDFYPLSRRVCYNGARMAIQREKKMAQPKMYEGTWEELAAHAEELRRYPKLRLVIPAEEPTAAPNEGMLEVLRQIEQRQQGRRYT